MQSQESWVTLLSTSQFLAAESSSVWDGTVGINFLFLSETQWCQLSEAGCSCFTEDAHN